MQEKGGAMASVLVLGMGNILKTDDGIGVHAVRLLAKEPLCGADMLELGTSLADCFFLLEGYDVVVALDAVHFGAEPGAWCWLSRGEMARAEGGLSLHECDLLDALDLANLRGRHPVLYVAGMEPMDVTGWSMELSAPVRQNMPAYLAMVRARIRRITEEAYAAGPVSEEGALQGSAGGRFSKAGPSEKNAVQNPGRHALCP